MISAGELSRRVTSPGRAEMFKEIDAKAAWMKIREQEVLRPRDFPYLELDVTHLTPTEAADQILLEAAKLQNQ